MKHYIAIKEGGERGDSGPLKFNVLMGNGVLTLYRAMLA